MAKGTRPGTDDLGLVVEWQYEFVGHGSLFEPRPDTITLDVGNRLCPGVLDQHQDVTLGRSTTELLFKHPEYVYEHLLRPWVDRLYEGQELRGRLWRPVVCTHTVPDFDAVVATLLVQELVQFGQFPVWAKSLVDISTRVDSAQWQPELTEDSPALKSVMMMMYALDEGPSPVRMRRALSYIRAEIDALETRLAERFPGKSGQALWAHAVFGEAPDARPQSVWESPDCGGWASTDDDAKRLVDTLATDLARFQVIEDKVAARAVDVSGLPVQGDPTKSMDARCAIIEPGYVPAVCSDSSVQEVKLLKFWLRHSGYPMTVIPVPPSDRSGGPNRCIVSLDPNYESAEGDKPSLRGLGWALEREEEERRSALVNAPQAHRSGRARYPWVTHDDPWYIGAGHNFTIVDSPRSGSYLDHEKIAEIAQDPTRWQPKVVGRLLTMSFSEPDEEGEGFTVCEDRGVFVEDSGWRRSTTSPPPSTFKEPKWMSDQGPSHALRWARLPGIVCHVQEMAIDAKSGCFADWLKETRDDEHDVAVALWLDKAALENTELSDDAELQRFVQALLDGGADPLGPAWSRHRLSLLDDCMVWVGSPEGAAGVFRAFKERLLLHRLGLHALKQATRPSGGEIQSLSRAMGRLAQSFLVQPGGSDPVVRALSHGLHSVLRLDQLEAALRRQQAELNDRIAHRQNRWMEVLLYILGVLGLFEAFGVAEGLWPDERLWLYAAAAAVLVLGGGGTYMLLRNKEDDSGSDAEL